MNIFKIEIEVFGFLLFIGMGIYYDYDRILDVDYWYVAIGGRDGRMEYKLLNWLGCMEWVYVKAEEAFLWAGELQALGVVFDQQLYIRL